MGNFHYRKVVGLVRGLSLLLISTALMTESGLAQTKKFIMQGGAPVPYSAFIGAYVGQQTGFFKEEGLDVEVRYASGAPQGTQVAAANQADVAIVTVEPLINGYDKGVRGKFLALINNKLIYYIAVPEDSPIKTVEDLRGKKIGVASFGSAAVPVVRSILRSAGIQPASDTLLPVGVMDQAMAALKSDKVQALGLYDGMYFALERAGFKFRYFHHPALTNFGNTGMFASDDTIKIKQDELCRFSRAYAKATLFAVTNPEAAVKMYWKVAPSARRGATDEEAMKNGLAEIAPMLKVYDIGFPPGRRYGQIDRTAFEKYIELNKQEGVINATPPVDALVTDVFSECMNKFDADAVRAKAKDWKE